MCCHGKQERRTWAGLSRGLGPLDLIVDKNPKAQKDQGLGREGDPRSQVSEIPEQDLGQLADAMVLG